MSQCKNLVSIVGLSLATALAGTGCLAQGEGDDVVETDIETTADQDVSAVADEGTGEAQQTFLGGFTAAGFPFMALGGFGGCGGFGFGGCGGFGFGGCGGFGFGGCGGFGFGGCGGCGGFW